MHKKNAFTLVELLVVMAIISVLAALLLPSLEKAMESARIASCSSNQKQLGLVLSCYQDDYDSYFPPYLRGHTAWNVTFGTYLDSSLAMTGCPAENGCKVGEYGYNYRTLGMKTYIDGYTRLGDVRAPSQTIAFADGYGHIDGTGYSSNLIENVYPGRTREMLLATATWARVHDWRHNDGTPVCMVDGHVIWNQWDILRLSGLWSRD